MDINIAKTLKKLRTEKGCTQEDLAKHFGISTQAVGKWERGEGYPDITLLPAIAMYFDITVDDLLDVGQARIEEKIHQYMEQSHSLMNRGEVHRNYELWEKAYAEFPNNEDVMCMRLFAMESEYGLVKDAEKKKALSNTLLEMGEKLLHSDDEGKRSCAIQQLAYHNKEIGNKEEAVRYARMSTGLWTTSNELLATILEGDEAVEQCQYNLFNLLDLIIRDVYVMQWQSGKYSHEEKVEMDRFCLNLMDLFFPDGNYLFFTCRMQEFYRYLSEELADLARWEECLDAVEKAAGFVISADTQPEGEFPYTSLLLNKLKYDRRGTTTDTTDTCSTRMLKDLEHPRFDGVRENARFAAVVEKLRQCANAVSEEK